MVSRHPIAVAAGVSAILALGLCFMVLGDPSHVALGHPANDVWNHIWGFDWVARSLLAGVLPLHTPLLNWPEGGSLWFIDVLHAVLTLPVYAVAGPVAAYNAAMVGNLWLCAFGAWQLAARVAPVGEGGARPGAQLAGFVAAVGYITTPHLLGQVYNGISETVAAGWLPLAVLSLREVFHAPTTRRAWVAGLLVGLTTLASWYYGVFAVLTFGGLLGRALWRLLARGYRRRRWVQALAGVAPTLLVGALGMSAVVAGPFWLFRSSMAAPDALVTRDPAFVWMTLVMHNMTDLASMFRPGKVYSPDLRAAFGEELIVVVYLGYALLVPAVLLMVGRNRLRAEAWFLWFLGFFVLGLGPFLYVGGAYVGVGGGEGWVPLPFLALYHWLPMFSRISHAYRFAAGAGLALSVLAAMWVIASRFPVRAAILVVAARLVESLFLSPAVWPFPVSEVQIPAVYRELVGGAILDLPITLPVLERSRVLVNQIVHGQPVPFGLNDPVPAYLRRNGYTRYLVEIERRNSTFLPPEVPLLDLAAGQAALVADGARWIVVHREGYTPAQYGRVTRFLDLTARPYADDGGVRVYALDAL